MIEAPRNVRAHRLIRGEDAIVRSPASMPERAKPRPLLDYRLCVLTNGRPCLRETLESFNWKVTPRPVEIVMFDDGLSQVEDLKMTSTEPLGIPFRRFGTIGRLGFCGATAALWQLAAMPGPDWILWLEDDFHFTRRVDLDAIAQVLEANAQLAQMALYRNPYSDEEHLAGGYLNLPGRSYEPRETEGHPWFEHDHYWTTNVSLFRRELAVENPWPLGAECEGHFGIPLREAGRTFGIWGDGEPWTRHVGIRSGHGY